MSTKNPQQQQQPPRLQARFPHSDHGNLEWRVWDTLLGKGALAPVFRAELVDTTKAAAASTTTSSATGEVTTSTATTPGLVCAAAAKQVRNPSLRAYGLDGLDGAQRRAASELVARRAEEMEREIALQRKMSHENVIRVLDVKESSDHTWVFLELANGGSLKQVRNLCASTCSSQQFDDLARNWMLQLCCGVLHLHCEGVVHRDIKAENALVSLVTRPAPPHMQQQQQSGAQSTTQPTTLTYYQVRVCDFGYAIATRGDLVQSCVGSKGFAPPEISNRTAAGARTDQYFTTHEMIQRIDMRRKHDANFHENPVPALSPEYDGFKADVWSLGVTLTEIFCGKPAVMVPQFNGKNADLRRLLQGIFTENPTERMSLLEVLAEPWLQLHLIGAKVGTNDPPPAGIEVTYNAMLVTANLRAHFGRDGLKMIATPLQTATTSATTRGGGAGGEISPGPSPAQQQQQQLQAVVAPAPPQHELQTQTMLHLPPLAVNIVFSLKGTSDTDYARRVGPIAAAVSILRRRFLALGYAMHGARVDAQGEVVSAPEDGRVLFSWFAPPTFGGARGVAFSVRFAKAQPKHKVRATLSLAWCSGGCAHGGGSHNSTSHHRQTNNNNNNGSTVNNSFSSSFAASQLRSVAFDHLQLVCAGLFCNVKPDLGAFDIFAHGTHAKESERSKFPPPIDSDAALRATAFTSITSCLIHSYAGSFASGPTAVEIEFAPDEVSSRESALLCVEGALQRVAGNSNFAGEGYFLNNNVNFNKAVRGGSPQQQQQQQDNNNKVQHVEIYSVVTNAEQSEVWVGLTVQLFEKSEEVLSPGSRRSSTENQQSQQQQQTPNNNYNSSSNSNINKKQQQQSRTIIKKHCARIAVNFAQCIPSSRNCQPDNSTKLLERAMRDLDSVGSLLLLTNCASRAEFVVDATDFSTYGSSGQRRSSVPLPITSVVPLPVRFRTQLHHALAFSCCNINNNNNNNGHSSDAQTGQQQSLQMSASSSSGLFSPLSPSNNSSPLPRLRIRFSAVAAGSNNTTSDGSPTTPTTTTTTTMTSTAGKINNINNSGAAAALSASSPEGSPTATIATSATTRATSREERRVELANDVWERLSLVGFGIENDDDIIVCGRTVLQVKNDTFVTMLRNHKHDGQQRRSGGAATNNLLELRVTFEDDENSDAYSNNNAYDDDDDDDESSAAAGAQRGPRLCVWIAVEKFSAGDLSMGELAQELEKIACPLLVSGCAAAVDVI